MAEILQPQDRVPVFPLQLNKIPAVFLHCFSDGFEYRFHNHIPPALLFCFHYSGGRVRALDDLCCNPARFHGKML